MQVITQDGFVDDPWCGTDPQPLDSYEGGPAVLLGADDDLAAIAPHLDQLKLIVIPFGSNADGRGFSLARSLREMGFEGYLRAQGHVLVDQFRAALRAGFSDVAISADQARRNPQAQWLAVAHRASYQARVFAG